MTPDRATRRKRQKKCRKDCFAFFDVLYYNNNLIEERIKEQQCSFIFRIKLAITKLNG